MNNIWSMYDELISGMPEDIIVDECIHGTVWTWLSAGPYCGVALTVKLETMPRMSVSSPVGRSLRSVAEGVRSWNFTEASAGMAAINAFYNTIENMKILGASGHGLDGRSEDITSADISARKKKNPFDHPEELSADAKVAVVGHFPHIEKKLEGKCKLSILERDPSKGDLPDSACEYILGEQDYAFITGMTFINKTLPRLLQLCGEKTRVSLVGPSTAMSPIVFKYGADELSGFCVTDPELAKRLIADGKRDIFESGIMVSLENNK